MRSVSSSSVTRRTSSSALSVFSASSFALASHKAADARNDVVSVSSDVICVSNSFARVSKRRVVSATCDDASSFSFRSFSFAAPTVCSASHTCRSCVSCVSSCSPSSPALFSAVAARSDASLNSCCRVFVCVCSDAISSRSFSPSSAIFSSCVFAALNSASNNSFS